MPILQAWVVIAEQINCLAPLPEDPESPLLTRMLFPTPYEVPEKKAKKKAAGTRKGLRRKVVSDSSSQDTEARSSNENGEEEEESPPQPGGEEKEGRPFRRGRRVQEGKDPPSGPLQHGRLQ